MKNTITIFGLGRMGSQIAIRLHKKKFKVFGWNKTTDLLGRVRRAGIFVSTEIKQLITSYLPVKNRIFWVMIPQNAVDDFILGEEGLGGFLKKGDIVIDGGNSFYKDSIRRAKILKEKGVSFFDCGTSGGVWGENKGFSLMVGGPKSKWPIIKPFIKALSGGDNYAYLGDSGAGHFAKMVHNGIEYGMMEAIGEGYAVLEASPYKFNLADVTKVYQKGSVIRSWLIDLCRDIFENENVEKTLGKIDATGEGEWTIKVAKELGVDVRVISDSLEVRKESNNPKNQNKFSNKIVALLRKKFGGHKIFKKDR